jgi:hypothetical protein
LKLFTGSADKINVLYYVILSTQEYGILHARFGGAAKSWYSTDDQLYAHLLIIEIVAHAHKRFMRI